MHNLLFLFCRHSWKVLLSLLLITLLATSQLSKVEVEISAEDLLVQNDPQRDYFKLIADQFGDEKVILLYLSDSSLVKPSQLAALATAVNQLQGYEFIDRVESLFSVPYLKTLEGYLNKDPYFIAESLPETLEEAEDIVNEAAKNPFIRHTLLADDKTAMALAIVLSQDLNNYSDTSIVEQIDRVTDSLKVHYHEVFSIGYQHVRNAVADKIRAEQGGLFPLAVVVLVACLFLMLRQLVDILIPVMTATISIVWTLGMMGAMNIPLNVVTSIIPILLIIVGSTEDIHLLSEFRRAQLNGQHKIDAIIQMSVKMGGIIVLTFITTFIGFISIGLSKIEVLWQFGILSATGLLFNFIIMITLIPALLRLTGDWKLDGKTPFFHTPDLGSKHSKTYFIFLKTHRKFIFIGLIALSIFAVSGINRININHSPIDSLNQDSPVRTAFEKVNQQLSGLESFSVIIDAGIQDTFLKTRYLNEIKQLQEFIDQQNGIRSSTSFADYLSLINAAFQELPDPLMPEADDIVNELMIFLNYEHVRSYVSEDYSRARILIRHHLSSTAEIRELVRQINDFIETELDSGLNATLTGDSILTLSATDSMINGQLKSIMFLLLSVIVIISMLFLDWKVGLIAAIPNIFPVIILFGVMGYFEIPLNIGTTMAAAIAIGIAVDDTMHFMLRYNNELKTKRNQNSAIYATLHNEALPIFATSLSLIGGFLVFMLSDFEPVRQFGMLSAIVMFAAVIADFVITPLMISTLRLVSLWDMISVNLRKEVISKSELFANMRPWQVRKFILGSRIATFSAGEVIFNPGQHSENIYMVLRGKVEVHHIDHYQHDVIEIIKTGDIFGEIAMLIEMPRTSKAIASQQCSLLIISRESINAATNLDPMTSAKLFYNLSRHVSKRFNLVVYGDSRLEHNNEN